jgi:PKD repeat protein
MKHVSVILVCALLIALGVPFVSADSTGYIQSSAHGSLIYYDASWITCHDATSANSHTVAGYVDTLIRSLSSSNKWGIYRAYYVFNTSSIPDDKEVKYATLKMYVFEKYDYFESNVSVVSFSPTNIDSIATSDYSKFGTAKIADTDIDTIGIGWNYFNITDASLISKTGKTAIGFRVSEDIDNTPPSWISSQHSGTRARDTSSYYMWLNVTYGDYSLPEAVITADDTSGATPLTVLFTDDSTGFEEVAPDYPEYTLSFGDGGYYSGDRDYTGMQWYHTYYTSGTYEVNYTVTEDGTTYYDTLNITVGASLDNYCVRVTGTDTNPIDGANVSIWYDGSYHESEDTLDGESCFTIPYNRMVNGTVTKTGYHDAVFDQYVSTWDTWDVVTLYLDNETPGTGDEYWNYIVTFRDASTLETLTNVFIDVYTDSDRTNLFTSENAAYGVWTGLLPNDTTYYFTASAANHLDLNWSYTLSGASVSVYKDLIPVAYGSLQPVMNIFVYDTGGTPLNGASVQVDSDIVDGFHLTNKTGYARHFCDNLAYGSSRAYHLTASMGGYSTEDAYVDVSTQQPVYYFFLERTAYPTVTPTGVFTPVETPIWSGDGGVPGNIKEQLINTLMTQFGVSQLEANILMGIILTLLCAVTVGGALASYGSGSGAGVGAMIGAVVGFSGSSVMGFFPIWILIVVIVLVFAAWFMFRGRDE